MADTRETPAKPLAENPDDATAQPQSDEELTDNSQVGQYRSDTPEAAGDAHAGDSTDADEAPFDLADAMSVVAAIIFACDDPISAAQIAQVAELPGRRAVRQAVEALNARYEQINCTFRIESIAGGYQLLTFPEYHDVLARLHKSKSDSKLSQAAMETLAIVAYRQPIIRADIESIRGVACGEVLRGLIEKGLVKIAGRAEVLGRPMLYGTTRRFLQVFGLGSLKDLPNAEELAGGAEDAPKSPAADESGDTAGDDQASQDVPAKAPQSGQAATSNADAQQPATETDQSQVHAEQDATQERSP